MIKIGVISDTHIYDFNEFPSQLLNSLKEVDFILHAGDLVDLAVLEGLKKIGPQVHAVWGNMDPFNVRKVLPAKKIIRVKQFNIGLTHGKGSPSNLINTVKEKFKEEHIHCIVYGHSHLPRNEVLQGVLFFNPGSPTDRLFAPYNSYGILEINKEIKGEIIKI